MKIVIDDIEYEEIERNVDSYGCDGCIAHDNFSLCVKLPATCHEKSTIFVRNETV